MPEVRRDRTSIQDAAPATSQSEPSSPFPSCVPMSDTMTSEAFRQSYQQKTLSMYRRMAEDKERRSGGSPGPQSCKLPPCQEFGCLPEPSLAGGVKVTRNRNGDLRKSTSAILRPSPPATSLPLRPEAQCDNHLDELSNFITSVVESTDGPLSEMSSDSLSASRSSIFSGRGERCSERRPCDTE